MVTLSEKITQLAKEVVEIEEQIDHLRKAIDNKHLQMVGQLVPILREIYAQWRPCIREKVVQIDFTEYPFRLQFLRVIEINGFVVRTAAGMSKDINIVYRIELDVKEYYSPVIIIPWTAFEIYFSGVDFRIREDYKTEFSLEHKQFIDQNSRSESLKD